VKDPSILLCTSSNKKLDHCRVEARQKTIAVRSFTPLTRLGRQHLEKEAANWSRLSTAISHVVRLEEA